MKIKKVILFSLMLMMVPGVIFATGKLKASLGKMPVYAESKDKGVLVDFTKAIAKELGIRIDIQVVPFSRSMKYVVSRKVDFHMPLIEIPDAESKNLNFDFSTKTIFHVNFVLYTNKNKPLDKTQLGKYKIETDRAHTGYFPFKAIPSSNIESSLKKLAKGRIDGFVFADFASDPLVRKNNLTMIKRQLYRVYDVKIILPKGERNGKVDKLLSKAINGLTKSGKFQKILGPIDNPYDNWQY